MVAPAVIAAGAALGGSVLGGLFGRSSAKRSMSFQREMAKKGHQYEVADLRAAGLNPILSGTGGPGAKASGGAIPPTPDFASSAISSVRLNKEIKLLNEQIRGAQYKADIDSTEAFIKRLATSALEKGKKESVKLFPIRMPTTAKAQKLQDENPTGTGFKDPRYGGFQKTKKSGYRQPRRRN